MISAAYDFHIHSCLSPCGDNDMTPNNLVNMAALSGCEIIALTDHNTCRNTPAAVKAGEEIGLLVLPGMELETAEAIHTVCLFERVEDALRFSDYVYEHMPHVPNRPEIFGEQQIRDENDELIGIEKNLLLVSTYIGFDEVLALAESYGGTAFPAHVDRDSYSAITALGAIPPEAGFKTAEVSRDGDPEALFLTNPELKAMRILRDSDSHYLESLSGEPSRIHLPEKSAKAVLDYIRQGLDSGK